VLQELSPRHRAWVGVLIGAIRHPCPDKEHGKFFVTF
jgi:hypothetical protein